MFGREGTPKCNLHGGETNGLLAFCGVLLERFADVVPNFARWRRTQVVMMKSKDLRDLPAPDFKAQQTQEPGALTKSLRA
eukprot:14245324-Alexandrium_andersonii.AAC.1